MKMLRDRIHTANAWECIADTLDLGASPEELVQSASDDIIYRAFVEGSIKSKVLRDKLHRYPFPNIITLGRYSDSDLEYHVGGGLATAMDISERAERHNRPFDSASNVLDFGCGTSRILRYMVEFLPGPQYWGTEVVREAIDWAKTEFPEIRYLHHDNTPHLEFPDHMFDIIYAYSIFTHFEEEFHLRWLSELHRILEDDAMMILTVHGERILRRCRDEEDIREQMCIGSQDYEEICKKFYGYGYVFYSPYNHQWLSQGGLDSEVFGITFISKEYIRDNWSGYFQILEHDEGAISNWQDWVVMRKL